MQNYGGDVILAIARNSTIELEEQRNEWWKSGSSGEEGQWKASNGISE